MFSVTTLCVFALLTFSSNSSPVFIREPRITLSALKHFNFTGEGAIKFVNSDRARAKSFLTSDVWSRRTDAGSSATTDMPVGYSVSIGVGSPPTYHNLLIDTGSSNTWVGAEKRYKKTSTSKSTGEVVSVSYGAGFILGTEYTDQVALGDSLIVENQSLGVAALAQGPQGLDGILGIGPTGLTCGSLPHAPSTCIPTITDNAFAQGLVSSNSVALSFEPTITGSEANGEITFGGTDSSRYTGSIAYVPITSTQPSGSYIGVDQSITYGSTATQILASTAGVIDSGTLLTLIASDAFSRYQAATGAVLDDKTGLLRLSASQYDNLESLFFTIGDISYGFTANAQIWPRSLNSKIGGSSDDVYLIIYDIGTPSGQGLDFVNGMTWLERFYLVYDGAGGRVGLATTPFTHTTSN